MLAGLGALLLSGSLAALAIRWLAIASASVETSAPMTTMPNSAQPR